MRRRLIRIGAVPLKNSVYVLPHGDDALEDFQWLRQEIEREGGEATVCAADFLDNTTDGRLIERFREAREEDYDDVAESARGLLEDIGETSALTTKLNKLEHRLEEVISMDWFAAPGRDTARNAITGVREAARVPSDLRAEPEERPTHRPSGCTWVTREAAKVDRIASAWLIRRFIDPTARFKFVLAQGYVPQEGELRFDMFEGEFTHVGEACTFETLTSRFELSDRGLQALAEIIHDIDCKDGKFGRAEAAGIQSLIHGITRAHADDEARLERGGALLDDLYEHLGAPST